MKEKLMANKNLIIGLVAVVIVAVVILCVSMFAKPSYKKQIKNWAKACESEEKMEKYVKKTANLRALYATFELMSDSDNWTKEADEIQEAFEKEYKDAKKKDYTDDEFVEDATKMFYVEDYEGIKITKIGKLEKDDDDDRLKGSKKAEIEAEVDDQKYEGTASFYKGKIVSISLDEKE